MILPEMIKFTYNDGGRAEAGFKGTARDCVTRSIAIAAQLPYKEVYAEVQRRSKAREKGKRRSNARTGVYTRKGWFRDYMDELGFDFVPIMAIGSGCRVHLRSNELPSGRLVVSVSKHYTAVINGVVHDTFDPSREGTRCVYGYFRLREESSLYS